MAEFEFSERWQQWRDKVDLDEYDARWETMDANGEQAHGEADFIDRFPGARVLDAGCGMGRLAIELDRRGRRVIGVDADAEMLAYARRRGPHIEWLHQDLATFATEARFDIVAMIGNILVFAQPNQRAAIIAQMASALDEGGLLITGSSYNNDFAAGLLLKDFDRWTADAGLVLEDRYATWDREPYRDGEYAVSVHRLASG